MKTRFLFAAALLVATTSATAVAQQQRPWIKDRRYGEGIGIRTGNLELHPGVAGEVGYDSNYFQRSGTANEPEISGIRFRLTPSLSLSTLGPQRRGLDGPGAEPPKLNFRAGIHAGYNEFFPLDSDYRDDASAQRDIGLGAGLNLDILPHKPWGGDLYGDFLRTVQPTNDPADDVAFDRDALRLGAGVVWRPGGGLFDWRLGYEFRYNYFESDNYRALNNTHHYLKTRGRWRFLPRTALMYDAEMGAIRYTDGGHPYLNDSTPVRTRIGLNGLVTNHFALLALAGWGASFYRGNSGAPVQDFDSVIAHGELKWFILPQPRLPEDAATIGLSSIAVGYIRDFTDNYLSDYYQRDRGYLNFSYFFAGMVLVSLEGGFSRYSHPAPYFATGALRTPPGGDFAENRVDAELFGEYRLSDTFGINTTLRYDASLSDNSIQNTEGQAGANELQFSRFQAFIGARWFM